MKSQKQMKIILNICGNHTYLIKIESKTIWRGDFRLKLTLNHHSPIDQEEEKKW
jgi:phosphotransferase system IIB component